MRRIIWLILACFLLLSACGLKAEFNALDSTDRPVFIPPTLAPTKLQALATQVLLPGATAIPPTPVQECSDVLSYLEDLSIPDGSQTEPNASLDKRWSVQNNGTCNWGEGYTIRLISGAEMGAEPTQALIPARAGSDAVIRIQFIAPEEPGTYISAWQAFTPAGLPFGDQFFINIVVANP
jgi:hypothetical protein